MADKTTLVLPGKRLSVPKPVKRTVQIAASVALTCGLVLAFVLANNLLMSKSTTAQSWAAWLAFVRRPDILSTMVLTATVSVLFVYWQRGLERGTAGR